jgi:hypothetical protein
VVYASQSKLRLAGEMARRWETISEYRTMVGKPLRKQLFRRLRRMQDNIKIQLRKIAEDGTV